MQVRLGPGMNGIMGAGGGLHPSSPQAQPGMLGRPPSTRPPPGPPSSSNGAFSIPPSHPQHPQHPQHHQWVLHQHQQMQHQHDQQQMQLQQQQQQLHRQQQTQQQQQQQEQNGPGPPSMELLRQQQQSQLGYGMPPSLPSSSHPQLVASTSAQPTTMAMQRQQQQQQQSHQVPPGMLLMTNGEMRSIEMRINASGLSDSKSNGNSIHSPRGGRPGSAIPTAGSRQMGGVSSSPSPFGTPPVQAPTPIHFRQPSGLQQQQAPGLANSHVGPHPTPPTRPMSIAPPGPPGPSLAMVGPGSVPGAGVGPQLLYRPSGPGGPPQLQTPMRRDLMLAAQLAAMAAGLITATPTSVGPCLSRLTAFNESLALALEDTDILDSLRTLVADYFTDSGLIKFGLFDRTAQLHKIFEIPCSAFPRFQHLNTLCGVLLTSVQPSFVREFFLSAHHPVTGQPVHVGYLLRADEAVWSSRYSNGTKVELNGTLTVHFVVVPHTATGPGGSATGSSISGSAGGGAGAGSLRIESMDFESRGHEEWVVKDSVVDELIETFYDVDGEGGGISQYLKEEEARTTAQSRRSSGLMTTRRKSTNKDEAANGKNASMGGPQSTKGHVLKPSTIEWNEEKRPPGLQTKFRKTSHSPSAGVGSFGITEMGMRCLEIAESVASLQEVVTHSLRNGVGPLQSLATLANEHRRRTSMNVPPGGGKLNGTGPGRVSGFRTQAGSLPPPGSIAQTFQNPLHNSFYMTAPINPSAFPTNSPVSATPTSKAPTPAATVSTAPPSTTSGTAASVTNSNVVGANGTSPAASNLANGIGGVNKRKATGVSATNFKALAAVADTSSNDNSSDESSAPSTAAKPTGGGKTRGSRAARNK
ncbi:hypothetical protein MVLG_04130 [Microbotryum lychnidis-dioicae p1A1 Lamole]|uniref:Uncharacterized protein n=1 Tax=Microbotryum lychnidis-dioicae (strain p1A1 Lamole / MvSl-1064) TaxID=683840 RepID=U5HA98_USTV1|nr:hypothetical protein MVLG_04130 [Microbotryum lychnidis-dioicae p1A1 Lamole]|eukprot:KDE05539.1 hypothetical protein MVLG_04130 [Microbotryum lychnidis-dioicae p1A1 Lamole]